MPTLRTLFLCCVVLSGAAAHAQQQDQNSTGAPIPAYRTPLSGAVGDTDTDTDDNSDQTQAVNQPLSGVQNLALGLETTRSYWQPHFDVSGSGDSNALETPHGLDWQTWTSASGGVDIHRVEGISDLTMSLTSGGMFSNNSMLGNGAVEGLNFQEKISFRRSTLSLFDQGSYLPESALGFGGLGAAAVPANGQALPGIAFNPNQAVLTGRVQTFNNADAIELNELLTSRTSLTYSGGYSLLRFFGSNSSLLNYGIVNARAGYNYQITGKDKIAVLYTFADFRYATATGSFSDHTLQISYGRVLAGKLAFQIAAGPQAVVSGTGTAATGGQEAINAAPANRVSWSLDTSLQYQERRYGLGLSYDHGVGAGSGVLVGAQMDTIGGTLTRQMSRTFASGLTGGYSRSDGLPGAGPAANQSYDYWFGGLNLAEPIGPSLGLTLSYQVQYQTSNGVACVGPACGGNVVRHIITVGLGWHERPLLF
jgi:hypothetical protein